MALMEQQKCCQNPVNKAAVLLSETYLNDLNILSDLCIRYGVHHSAKYLNI